MAQTILLKRRTADATAPSASDLTTGEVAVNAYSGKLYIKKTDGTVTEVSGSGGGSGSFPAVYNTYKYTATNGQTTFVGNDSSGNLLTYNVGNLIVFLNGVLLVPTTDYVATTGNTVVLQDGATTNDILTIVAFTATIGDGNVAVDTFSGDGSTTAFTLAANPQNENNTQVFIDGIYQSKSNYSVSGTTLTFSTAPPNNTSIEVTTGSREVTQYTATTLSLPNAGMSITGGDLDIPSDSRKIKLGASNDLQIFHDGTNNYIQGGTGDLRIDAKSGERGIVVTPDGATTLYYDNSAKLATVTGGVTITGTATATTFVGALTGNASTATSLATARTIGGTSFDGTANIAVNLAATATALANARTIGGTSFDGTANIVPANAVSVTGAAQSAITSVGTLTGLDIGSNSHTGADPALGVSIDVNDYVVQFANTRATAGQAYGVRILAGSNSSDSSLYVRNKANDADYFFVRGDGNVGIGTNSPSFDFVVNRASAAATALISSGNDDAMLRLYTANNVGKWRIIARTNDDLSIENLNSGASAFNNRLTIMDSGNVGINQASPAAKLDIKGDTTTYAGMAKIYLTDTSSNSERRNWAIGNGGSGYGHFTIGLSNAADGDPQASGTHTNPFIIDHVGNVGIGGANPTLGAKLEVKDNTWSSGAPYGALTYIEGGAVNDLNWGHLLVTQTGTTTDTGGRISFGANGQNPIAGIRTKYKGATYGDLAFLTRPSGGTNTEAMNIDSNGHTRFGSSGDGFDSAWADGTYGNTEVAIDGGGGYGVLHFRGDGAGSTNTRFSMGAGDDKFYMAYDDVDARHNITVDGGGHVTFAKNLIMTNGQGISFANTGTGTGTSSVSHILNDYEEGTWSPGIGEGAISVGGAKYTKIGNLVTVTANIYGFTNRTSGNAVTVNNLPFAQTGSGTAVGGLIGRHMDKVVSPYVNGTSNNTLVNFYTVDSGGYTSIKHNQLNSSSADFHFTITYRV